MEQQCRICLLTAEESPEAGELLAPCCCRGSRRAVHLTCLHESCASKSNFTTCGVCNQRYVGAPLLRLAEFRVSQLRDRQENDGMILDAQYDLACAYLDMKQVQHATNIVIDVHIEYEASGARVARRASSRDACTALRRTTRPSRCHVRSLLSGNVCLALRTLTHSQRKEIKQNT